MTYTHLEKLRPTGSVILFDEPELHLHPTLQRRVIAHLRRLTERGNNQIWAITQSEGIVDTTEYKSLYAMNSSGDPAIEHVTERGRSICSDSSARMLECNSSRPEFCLLRVILMQNY
jgi:predicted ATP-dependent endonuclease of OLD family